MSKDPHPHFELPIVIVLSSSPVWLPVVVVSGFAMIATSPQPIPLVAGAVVGSGANLFVIRIANRRARSTQRPRDLP